MKFELKYLIVVIIFVLLFGLVVLGITSSKHYWTDEKAPELIKYENNVDKVNDQTAKKDLEVAKIINQPGSPVESHNEFVATYINLTDTTPSLTIIYDIFNIKNNTPDPILYIFMLITTSILFVMSSRGHRLIMCIMLIPVSIFFGTIYLTIFLVFYATMKMFGLYDGGLD